MKASQIHMQINLKIKNDAFVDKGIPVVVGECGFRGGSDRTYKFEGVSYMLKKYGLAGCIWDNHGTQGTTDNL